MKQIDLLILGCGSIGQRHARLLGERPDVRVSVCDTLEKNLNEAAQLARAAGRFTSFEEALHCGAQAAFICTPNESHAEQAIRCMQAGMDVFVEKPMAHTATAALNMNAVAQETGRLIMVGYVMRFHPALIELRRRVDAGEIGNLVGGRAMVGTYFTLMCARTPFRLQTKGALVIDYTHEIDFLAWFFGETAEVTARAIVAGDLQMRPDPNLVAAILSYRSGAIVSLHMDYIQLPQRRILELYGDKGVLVLDFQRSTIEHYRAGKDGAHVQFIEYFRDNLFREEHAAFLRALETRNAPITGEDGLAALRVAEAILKSAELRRPVEL